MSILARLLYDEAQARSYREEAEAIVADVNGGVCPSSRGTRQRAVTAVMRSLTLYDLYHEPGAAAPAGHPVRMAVPEERYDLACRAASESLRQTSPR